MMSKDDYFKIGKKGFYSQGFLSCYHQKPLQNKMHSAVFESVRVDLIMNSSDQVTVQAVICTGQRLCRPREQLSDYNYQPSNFT